MILRGRTPRALTLTGLAAVLVLGLVLLPLVPTWAQDPPPAAAVQKEEKAGDRKDDDDADKARKEYQKLQDDFIKLQRQMEDKRRELETKLQEEFGKAQQDLIKRMREAAQKAGIPGGPGFLSPPPIINPGNPGAAPLPQPGIFAPPNVPAPAAINPLIGGQQRPDLERRLDDLERKLDKLIERLGGKAPPNRAPGGDPNAAPRSGTQPAPAVLPEPKR